MIKRPRMNRRNVGLMALVLAVLAVIAAACSGDPETDASDGNRVVFAQPDWLLCIYDRETGELTELPPVGGRIEVEDDAIVFGIPTSQRFLDVSTTEKRDPGMPQYLFGQDATYKQVGLQGQMLFYFNLEQGCEFVSEHMRRNIPQHILAQPALIDKFGFNVRTRADALNYLAIPDPGTDEQNGGKSTEDLIKTVPWFKFLGENQLRAMREEAELLLPRYSWEYYEFEFPVNADGEGILPCITTEPVTTTDAEGNEVTTDKCIERAAPKGIAKNLLEDEYSINADAALESALRGQYFCGNAPALTGESTCEPVRMDILDITLGAEYADLATERRAQIDLRVQAENNARQAELIREATAAQLELERAQDEQELELKRQENAQAEALRREEYEHEQALARLEEENGGVSPEVLAAQRQAEIQKINDEVAAAKTMLPCTIANATGIDCARILAALNESYTEFPPYVYPTTPVTPVPAG